MKVIGSSGESKVIEPKEAVLVTFEARIANYRSVRNGPLFQKAKSWLIVVGESDVISALDMVRSAVILMHAGVGKIVLYPWWQSLITLSSSF